MNPYKNIWTRTGETIDYLLLHSLNNRKINLNFLIAGLTTVLLSTKNVKTFNSLSFLEKLLMLIPFLILTFFFFKYLLPFFYLIIGKIWKGKASLRELILVMSLALIPEIIYLTYILVILAVRGEIVEVNFLIRFIGWLFSLKILTIGISRVQGFTYGLALLNVFLPALLLGLLGLILKSY